MFKKFKNKKGFTLIELLLSIALVTMLFTISIPMYSGFQNSNNLDSASRIAISAINEAKVLSNATYKNDLWSVNIDSNGVTVFKGNNYGSRDVVEDRRFPFPSAVAVSGDTSFSFSKGKAELSQNRQLLFSLDSKSISISVEKYGNIKLN